MKKIMLMMAVALISVCGCAQKKAVTAAKNKALAQENPDFVGARETIAPALTDSTTMNVAETWYYAGLIGYKEIEYYTLGMGAMKGGASEELLGNAALESFDYWMIADSLSQILKADKKGNLKPADPKTRKQIAEKLPEYFQKQYLMVKAFDCNKKEDYEGAYEATMKHLAIPKLEMMQDPKLQSKMVVDSNYYYYKYCAGMFAFSAKNYENATKVFTDLYQNDKNVASERHVILALEYLAEIKKVQQDTTGYIDQLKLGFQLYPQEPWFVQNLINYYLQVLKDEKGALEYVDQAIASDPQMQYYNLKGNLFLQANRFEDAKDVFDYMLTVDPNSADAYEGIGRAYYFKGEAILEAAGYMSKKEFEAEQAKAKEMYKKSIEPLEFVRKNAPNLGALNILKSVYYKLGMYEENHKVIEEINNL